ncbi:DUF2802 domain-containing protein [Celerinatantimonas yamalensis]|uniref:DUF2802 domain-containing protein n=1 Tax=Celerinatantimonas yamalensis TaxID=559956 RepID=A0ABW9G6Y0_9GAMM
MNWIEWIAPAVAIICVVALLVLIRRHRRGFVEQQQKLTSFELLIKQTVKGHKRIQKQLVEIHAANHAMVTRIAELEHLVEQTAIRQNEIVTQDPDSKLYSRAVKMVELGADIDEVMRECELPRAEAELLYTLHGKPMASH